MPLRKGRKPEYLPVVHEAMRVCAFMKYAVSPLPDFGKRHKVISLLHPWYGLCFFLRRGEYCLKETPC